MDNDRNITSDYHTLLARGFFVKAIGARLIPGGAKRIMMGALVVSAAFTVGTWEVYDKGFWGAQGLLTIDSYEELEAMRTQPTDVHPHDFNEFTDSQSYGEYSFTEANIILPLLSCSGRFTNPVIT